MSFCPALIWSLVCSRKNLALVRIELPPGVQRRGTLYQNKDRWYESNFVRWFEGGMKPVGGWAQRITTAITGKGRAVMAWRSNDNTRFFAVGTEQKLYAATPSLTAMVDITPVGFTTGHADAAMGGGYGVGLYGVDVITSSGKPFVVDINTFPGFKGVPNAAELLANFIRREPGD